MSNENLGYKFGKLIASSLNTTVNNLKKIDRHSIKRIYGQKHFKKCIVGFFTGLAFLLLFLQMTGPNIQDAQEAGFSSVTEMKDLQSKGFKTKFDYDESQAKNLGFDNAAQRKDATNNGIKTRNEYDAFLESEKLNNADWVKIYTDSTFTEYKGGIYIEKNWFSDDRIAVKPSTSSYSTTKYYFDKNSIIEIAPEIKLGKLREVNSNDRVIGFEVNCPANTIRKIVSFYIHSRDATTKSEIDQRTGEKIITEIPAKVELTNLDKSPGQWGEVSGGYQKKFRDALCSGDLSYKENTEYRRY